MTLRFVMALYSRRLTKALPTSSSSSSTTPERHHAPSSFSRSIVTLISIVALIFIIVFISISPGVAFSPWSYDSMSDFHRHAFVCAQTPPITPRSINLSRSASPWSVSAVLPPPDAFADYDHRSQLFASHPDSHGRSLTPLLAAPA